MSRAKAAACLELVSLVVEKMLAEQLDDALDKAFDMSGYVSNFTTITNAELAAVLVAIAGVVDAKRRKTIVHALVFFYEMESKKGAREWVKANALADYAMREPEMIYREWRQANRKAA